MQEEIGKQPARDLVERHHNVQGQLDEHQFDVGVSNGKPFLAAQGLSFEISDTNATRREIRNIAWAIDDVREKHHKLPLGVLVLPPRHRMKMYDHARTIFEGLGADVLHERDVEVWARGAAKKLTTH